MMSAPRKILLIAGVCLGLTACGQNSSFEDLNAFVEEIRARPKGKIEPLPEFKTYQAFTYGAANRRSPFDAPQDVKAVAIAEPADVNVKPDLDRPKELLENFAVTDLRMVGTLKRVENATLWALVNDNAGGVHRVRAGQYMGKNHGRVVAIKEGQIDLVEIVPNGRGGWVERPRSLALEEQKL